MNFYKIFRLPICRYWFMHHGIPANYFHIVGVYFNTTYGKRSSGLNETVQWTPLIQRQEVAAQSIPRGNSSGLRHSKRYSLEISTSRGQRPC